jgi:hypothetical protein
MKSKEVRTGCNLAEFCEEGCGSKRAVLSLMMMATINNDYFPMI